MDESSDFKVENRALPLQAARGRGYAPKSRGVAAADLASPPGVAAPVLVSSCGPAA